MRMLDMTPEQLAAHRLEEYSPEKMLEALFRAVDSCSLYRAVYEVIEQSFWAGEQTVGAAFEQTKQALARNPNFWIEPSERWGPYVGDRRMIEEPDNVTFHCPDLSDKQLEALQGLFDEVR